MTAKIVELTSIRSELSLDFPSERPLIVAASGAFDPVHPGNLLYLKESAEMGDVLIVIVNDDNFLKAKRGRHFMSLEDRCLVLGMIKGVDYVVPYHAKSGDLTVIGALEEIVPHVFTKGGDKKNEATIPEWDVCQELNITLALDVGMETNWSSLNYLKDWGEYYKGAK
jgi:cytidyltransferase-like protein